MIYINQFRNKILNKSIFVYLLVGGGAFLTDFLTFYVLSEYKITPLYVANTLGLLLGLVLSFMGNRFFTFNNVDSNKRHEIYIQFLMYGGLVLFNSLVSYFVIVLFIEKGYDKDIGKVVSMLMIIIWNYLIYKNVIFKDKTSI